MGSPIRITGMNSGLDTESIIKALTTTQQEKVKNLEGDQKRLTWKQDKWKELNKKVTDLFNGKLGAMRYTNAYSKKVTNLSNESIASVVTGETAMNTTQTLKVSQVASSAYQTGGKLKTTGGKDATASTKLSDLIPTAEGEEAFASGSFQIKVGDKTKSIDLSATDTISSAVSKLQKAGVNASFDEGQGRLYISSKETGDASSFEIVGGDEKLLAGLGLSTSYEKDSEGNYVLDAEGNKKAANGYQAGRDAKITLNGVDYTSKNGNFNINGLTITANQVGETTLTTKSDTSGVYDMIKDFFKEYNELINEMDKLYHADSAKSYKMLTEEQKEAMTEEEVEDWENKIKDGLLSRDGTLYDVSSAMKEVMSRVYTVKDGSGNEKSLSLANFGINTLSYFSAKENEKYAFHIDGDKDSEYADVKSAEDKLSKMIANDPDVVTNFFTDLSKALYGKIFDLMKVSEFSSSFTLYEDRMMNKQYSSYNDKISDANEKLTSMEDKYYKKFSKMETALGTLNSTQSALAGYFGGGSY